ncbi:condensation domain-containing protein [Dactylosporangium cerinum]
MRTLGHWMPIGGALPLRPGTTVEDVAGELRHHLSRHPTLRTLLRIPAGGGTPTQEVHASGVSLLEVYDTSGADPSDVAEALAGRYRDTDLDFTVEYPIRMAVVLRDGVPSHVVALISHFAADGAGAQAMLRDVAARSSAPVAGRQPLEQAQWQASPAGRRQNESALRHFEGILRTMPPARFRAPAGPERPRFWRAGFDSAALPLALRALTARTGADPSAVLLAVFAMAVHATCGIDPVVVRPLVSNRFRPGLADVVCTAVQAGLCRVPVAGLDFDDVLPQARRAATTAYKLAYFDQRDLFALVDRVGAERGERLEIGCFLNDRRDPSAGGPEPTAGEIEATLSRSAFGWVVRRAAPGFEPMILDVEDTATGLRCTAHTDTAHISPADTEALLRHLERIAVACAVTASAVRSG